MVKKNQTNGDRILEHKEIIDSKINNFNSVKLLVSDSWPKSKMLYRLEGMIAGLSYASDMLEDIANIIRDK